jgi:hypothetical protein
MEGTEGIDVQKILGAYLELAKDPSLVDRFRKDRDGYHEFLKEQGLSAEEIDYVMASADQPAHVMLTVWPQPPTVWTPPTVFG